MSGRASERGADGAAPVLASVERRAAFAVGLVALALAVTEAATHYVPSTWIHRDGRFHVNVAETLFARASLEQPYARSWYDEDLGWNRTLDAGWSNIALGARGERYPKHTWVLPAVSLPLYALFGLLGTLLTNVLFFGAAGGLGYRFARAFSAPAPAALATVAFLFGSSVREVVYDFHVDALGVALALGALGAAARGQGLPAGALAGVLILCRPTHALLVPALGLLLLGARAPEEARGAATAGARAVPVFRRTLRAVGLALVGGAVVLALGAAVHTVLFGRPWLAGYNRALVVEGGAAKVADVADLFTVPLEAGLDRYWNGAFGLRKNHAMLGLAAPGLLWLLGRRPLSALGMVGVVASTAVFMARYVWEGDRFSWFALAALLPAVAVTLDVGGRALARLVRRPSARAPFGAAVAAAGGFLLVHLGTRGHGGLGGAWAAGRAMFTAATEGPALATGVAPDASIAWPSAARLVVFALAGLCALGLTRAAMRLAPAGPAAAASLGVLLLPQVRETLWAGGRPALALTSVALALGAAGAARLGPGVLFATVAAVLAPSLAVAAPLLVAVLVLAARPSARDAPWQALRARLGSAARGGAAPDGAARNAERVAAADAHAALARAALGVVGASLPAALLFVADRASPGGLGGLAARLVSAVAGAPDALGLAGLLGDRGAWARAAATLAGFNIDNMPFVGSRGVEGALAAWTEPSSARGVGVGVLPLAVLGMVSDARRRPAEAWALGSLLVSFMISTLDPQGAALAGPLPLALGLAAAAATLGERYGRCSADPGAWLRGGRLLAAVLAAALLALVAGRLARAAEDAGPLHLASERAVRAAEVRAGRTPCDFLAWEHYAWECSHLDYGTYSLTGLLTDEPPEVGGVSARAVFGGRPPLVVGPGLGRRPRLLRWTGVEGGARLRVRYAVPDERRGAITLRFAVDGTEVGRIDVPAEPTREVRAVDFPTPAALGRRVTLEVTAEPGLASAGHVALDAWFE